MLVLLFTAILSCTAAAQAPAAPDRIEQVRTLAAGLAVKKERAYVLRSDLSDLKGRVTRVSVDSFSIDGRKKHPGITIPFADVLAIASKKGSLSFIPDPGASGHGTWTDLAKLPPNTPVEITLSSGEIRRGLYRSSTAGQMVLTHIERNEEWTFRREEISRVHRVRYRVGDSAGAVGGLKKGVDVGRGIDGAAGGTDHDAPELALMAAGIGALVGLIKGTASSGPGKNYLGVLIYSQ